jgi:hypothetical protein
MANLSIHQFLHMENPAIWMHDYTFNGVKKSYRTELIHFNPNDYDTEDPSGFLKIRPELDKKVNDFLEAYHVNPLIPMRFDIAGKPFQISMGEGDSIQVEKLVEDTGLRGYGHE